MIYTVTFNPSLDYVVKLDELKKGEICRAIRESVYPGGKGVNVSVVLSNLGHKSRALGFTAGFTGEQLEKELNAFGCDTDFITLDDGLTRINVKIHAKEESEINGQGPDITPRAIQELFAKLDKLKKDDILVLAGSIPDTLPEDIYEQIMERLAGKQVKVVADATRDLLKNVLKYHPFLIKPNNHELGEMFDVELKSDEEIIVYAKKLQDAGAGNVLVSMAGDGGILLTESGNTYKKLPPKGTVVNSVGAGDSMVAGFLTGWLNTGDYERAFELGLAAGSASAFTQWLADKEEITSLLNGDKSSYGL